MGSHISSYRRQLLKLQSRRCKDCEGFGKTVIYKPGYLGGSEQKLCTSCNGSGLNTKDTKGFVDYEG